MRGISASPIPKKAQKLGLCSGSADVDCEAESLLLATNTTPVHDVVVAWDIVLCVAGLELWSQSRKTEARTTLRNYILNTFLGLHNVGNHLIERLLNDKRSDVCCSVEYENGRSETG